MTRRKESKLEALPVLPSLNLDETVAFYCGELGFENPPEYRDETYAILQRGNLELHFWLTQTKEFCENSSVYIRSDTTDDLHREFVTRGVSNLSNMMVRPWGMEEFYIPDPHGNLLKFGRISSNPQTGSDERK
ncbi:MAG: VOC family protein [Pseudomonadota bacterium]